MKKTCFVLLFSFLLTACGGIQQVSQRRNFEQNKLNDFFDGGGRTVRIIEFLDFGCESCQKAAEIIPKLKKEFGEKIQIEYRNLALSADFRDVAEAAECARNQNKFQAFHDEYFSNHFGSTDKLTLSEIGLRIGVEEEEYQTCIQSGVTKEKVALDTELAKKYGAKRTPFFVINGDITFPGMPEKETFSKLIRELLKPPRENAL